MTYEQIYSMISGIGLPCAYYAFPEKMVPPTPYIVFYYPGRDDDAADNINYGRILTLNIELYSDEKDFDHESEIEAALTSAGLFFVKSEMYIDSERMYEVLYESEIAFNEN